MLSIYNGTWPNCRPKPSLVIMLEQNTRSFVVNAEATSLASMIDIAVRLWTPVLKPTGSLPIMMKYAEVDLPSSGLLPQFASENW